MLVLLYNNNSRALGTYTPFYILKLHTTDNFTKFPRYLLFCEGGIFSSHALTLVGTYRDNIVNVALKFTLQVNITLKCFNL